MTVTLSWLDQQRFSVAPISPPLPVFVRDMPHPRSSADTAHLGLAEMVAVLVPVLPAGTSMARVRLAGGAVRHVSMDAICPPTNIAPTRLGPRAHAAPAARDVSHA
jgi:hypothetical protein